MGQVGFHTTKINQNTKDINTISSRLLRIWFKIGSYCCFIFSILFFGYLCYNLFKTTLYLLAPDQLETFKPEQNLMILIPGITIPFDEVPVLCIVLFVSAILHEFGHSLCASVLNVSTEEFGANIFLFIPSAFVGLSFNDLQLKNNFEKIQIFTAGAWHNIMSGLLALGLFFLLFPNTNTTYIVNVNPNSSLYSHLIPGEEITKIGQCSITNQQSWTNCLEKLIKTKKKSFCINKEGLLKKFQKNF